MTDIGKEKEMNEYDTALTRRLVAEEVDHLLSPLRDQMNKQTDLMSRLCKAAAHKHLGEAASSLTCEDWTRLGRLSRAAVRSALCDEFNVRIDPILDRIDAVHSIAVALDDRMASIANRLLTAINRHHGDDEEIMAMVKKNIERAEQALEEYEFWMQKALHAGRV